MAEASAVARQTTHDRWGSSTSRALRRRPFFDLGRRPATGATGATDGAGGAGGAGDGVDAVAVEDGARAAGCVVVRLSVIGPR
jgi:hypothetical protein